MTKVNDFKEIQEAYKVVKAQHISSSHIMCGYRLFGAKHYILQDYSDDGEVAGGRHILEALKGVDVWNMVVFVVRYHDGPNLGKARFDIIAELSKRAIMSFKGPLNYGTNQDPEMMKILKAIKNPRRAKYDDDTAEETVD